MAVEQDSQPARRLTATHLRLQRPPAESVYSTELLASALLDSLRKFDPRVQARNPVMFVVWLGAIVTAALAISPSLFGPTHATKAYNAVLTAIPCSPSGSRILPKQSPRDEVKRKLRHCVKPGPN